MGCWGSDLGMIQAHYIYCALCFYCYYISSTSDHQASDLRGWGPLAQFTLLVISFRLYLENLWRFNKITHTHTHKLIECHENLWVSGFWEVWQVPLPPPCTLNGWHLYLFSISVFLKPALSKLIWLFPSDYLSSNLIYYIIIPRLFQICVWLVTCIWQQLSRRRICLFHLQWSTYIKASGIAISEYYFMHNWLRTGTNQYLRGKRQLFNSIHHWGQV